MKNHKLVSFYGLGTPTLLFEGSFQECLRLLMRGYTRAKGSGHGLLTGSLDPDNIHFKVETYSAQSSYRVRILPCEC